MDPTKSIQVPLFSSLPSSSSSLPLATSDFSADDGFASMSVDTVADVAPSACFSNRRAFEIDADPSIAADESRFFEKHGFVRLCDDDAAETTGEPIVPTPGYRTVLHSRALNSEYACVRPATAIDTRAFLDEFPNGHTLSVSDRSYVKPLIIDVDCLICHNEDARNGMPIIKPNIRNGEFTHLIASLLNTCVQRLVTRVDFGGCDTVERILNAPVIFRRRDYTERANGECGGHIHYPMLVSAPLYAYIVKQLQAETTDLSLKIDAPSALPLPASAKRTGNRYEPTCSADDERVGDFPVLGAENTVFFDIVKIWNATSQPPNSSSTVRLPGLFSMSFLQCTRANKTTRKHAAFMIKPYQSKTVIPKGFLELVVAGDNCSKRTVILPGSENDLADRFSSTDRVIIDSLADYLNRTRYVAVAMHRSGNPGSSPSRNALCGVVSESTATPSCSSSESTATPSCSSSWSRRRLHDGSSNGLSNHQRVLTTAEKSLMFCRANAASLLRFIRTYTKLFCSLEESRRINLPECFVPLASTRNVNKRRKFRIGEDSSSDDDAEASGSETTSSSIRAPPENYLEIFDHFVNTSSTWHDSMAIQHFVVALCLELKLVKEIFGFRSFLRELYHRNVTMNRSIAQFVERFDPIVCSEYYTTCGDLLHFLSLEIRMDMEPGYRINTFLKQLLYITLSRESVEAITQDADIDAALKNKTLETRKFVETLRDQYLLLKMLTCDSGIWYVYGDNGHYSKICIPELFASYPTVKPGECEAAFKVLAREKFTPIQPFVYLSCSSVGVFNAITGLYATSIPMLRSMKPRNYSVAVDFVDEPLAFDRRRKSINRGLVVASTRYSRLVDTLLNGVDDIHVSCVLASALIDLASVESVTSKQAEKFLAMVEDPEEETFSSLSFLVEFYRIDPKFFAFILFVTANSAATDESSEEQSVAAKNRSGEKKRAKSRLNESILLNFKKLKTWFFPLGGQKASWCDKLRQQMPKIEVPRRDNETHLSWLKRVVFVGATRDELTTSEILHASIFCVLMIKLYTTHKPFLASSVLYHDPSECVTKYANGVVDPDYSELPEKYRRLWRRSSSSSLRSANGEGRVEIRPQAFEKYVAMMNLMLDHLHRTIDDGSVDSHENCDSDEDEEDYVGEGNESDDENGYGGGISARDLRLARWEKNDERVLTYAVSLLKNCSYNQEMVTSYLHGFSITTLSQNLPKIAVILTGPKHTGKSKCMDILHDQFSPSVHRSRQMQSAEERSNVSARCLLLIINEISQVNGAQMKSTLGNDRLSGKLFYTQVFENLNNNQAFIFGATNNVMRLDDKNECDSTFVDRLYSVTFSMKHTPEKMPSLFHHIVESTCPTNLYPMVTSEMAKVQSLLLYLVYAKTRDSKTYAPLTRNTASQIEYRHKVMKKHSPAYKLMTEAGFERAEGMYVDRKKFESIMRNHIKHQTSDEMNAALAYARFWDQFESEYAEVDAETGSRILNVQTVAFVKHTERYFALEKKDGDVISRTDLNERLAVCFADEEERENAKWYFLKKYSILMGDQENINDYRFVYERAEPFSTGSLLY